MGVVGVLLVCYSSRGHQLVFSYPVALDPSAAASALSNAVDPYQPRHPHQTPHHHHHHSNLGVIRPGEAHPASAASLEARAQHQLLSSSASASLAGASERIITFNVESAPAPASDHCAYARFDPQLLSDFLSPKVALCDRVFRLAVDELLFVGHPTLLNADRPGTGHRFARRIQRKQLLHASSDADAVASANHDDDALVAPSVLNTPNPPTPLVPSARTRAFSISSGPGSSPLPPIATTPAMHTFPSSPLVGSGASGQMTSAKVSASANQHQHQLQLTMFNLVFAIIPDDADTACEIDTIYTNVLAKVTSGLKYEQLRRGYIKRETDLIMSIREELHNGPGHFITAPTMKRILQESSLARLLAHLYHSVTHTLHLNGNPLTAFTSHTHVDLNSSVDISILIEQHVHEGAASVGAHEEGLHHHHHHHPHHTHRHHHHRHHRRGAGVGTGGACPFSASTTRGSTALGGMGSSQYEVSSETFGIDEEEDGGRSMGGDGGDGGHCAAGSLRPYQALLLLYHAEEILKSLPADSAPLLHELIEIVTPTQSLDELAFILHCSLSHLYRLASHLVFWKKAKIIDVINFQNVYLVAKDADLTKLTYLETELDVRIKDLDLGKMLSVMSYPRPFGSLFGLDKEDINPVPYLEAIALFLRNNLIEQHRMRILIIIPKRIWSSNPQFENFVTQTTRDSRAEEPNVIIQNPLKATPAEREMISMIAMTQAPPLASVFLRLVPYFDGRTHTQEIAHRESMQWKELRIILSKYREFLLTWYIAA